MSVRILLLVEYIMVIPVISGLLLLSLFWDFHLVKEIGRCFKSYRGNVEKAKSNPLDNYETIAHCYKTEMIKYVFLLLINITEFVSMPIYGLGAALTTIPNIDNYDLSSNQVSIHNCTSQLIQAKSFELQLILNPINSIIVSIGQIGFMYSIVFGICLMKFLHKTFHDINSNPFPYIMRLLSATGLVAVLLIISGAIPQLMILHKLLKPTVQIILSCIWFQHTRIFYKTLKWRVVEFKVRGCSKRLLRRSVVSCNQFAVIMTCIGIAGACLPLLAEILEQCFFLGVTALYYGPCLFNHLYGSPYYQPLIATPQQFKAFQLSTEYETYLNSFLLITACLAIASQYVLATVMFLAGIVGHKLGYRFGCVRTSFTPNLTSHLLERQQA